MGVSLTHAKHAFLFFLSLSLSPPPIGSVDRHNIIEMQLPFLPLLLFLALCVGFTAAAVGKCADGSEGLTIAALKAGTASAATCVPATAFEYYSGDVELTGDDCKSLARIELFAFASMNGKVTIDCVLGKLEHVGAGAFLVGYGAGNAASSINLSGALLLEDIGVRAFQGFKGAIAISGARSLGLTQRSPTSLATPSAMQATLLTASTSRALPRLDRWPYATRPSTAT